MKAERDFKGYVKSSSDTSLLEDLFEELDVPDPNDEYDPKSQTWTHRDWIQFSPVKLSREM